MARMPFKDAERVRMQSTDEWLEEYETGNKIIPKAIHGDAIAPTQEFKYLNHRTTRLSRLVMSFMNIETGEVADAFFNVDIRAQRGLKKYYRIGNTGQFFPKPHSKFRKFWMAAVGSPPRSWSRAHLEMRPRMKGLIFTGDVTPSRMSNGKNYMMIKNLQL